MLGSSTTNKIVIKTIMFYFICGCAAHSNIPINSNSGQEITSQLKRFKDSTTYDEIVKIFGKPSKEFNPPSNPDEEYVLYYRFLDNPERGFWIMLHYPEKTYWYSSNDVVDLGVP